MKRREQLVSPKQANCNEVVVEGGYFDVLGAGDESDDHESLGEALFESDAEFWRTRRQKNKWRIKRRIKMDPRRSTSGRSQWQGE